MLKKNLFYNILLSGSQFIFPLVTFPYASRILGPHGIGSINFIDSFTQYFLLLSVLGVPIYGVREISRVKDDVKQMNDVFNDIFFINILSAFFFSVVYLIFAFSINSLFMHLDLVLIGISIIVANVFSFEWFFQGTGNFSYITKRTLFVRLFSIIFLFIFLKEGSPPKTYYLITASVFILNGISNVFYISKFVKFSSVNISLRKHIKPLAILLSSTLAINAYVLIDNMILGFFKGESAVGFYSTAVRIVKMPLVFIGAVSAVIIPAISNARAENNLIKVKDLLRKSFSYVVLLGVPVSIGLIVCANFIIFLFAGKQFSDSIMILKILSPSILIIGLSNMFGLQVLTNFNKERMLLKAVIIAMIFSLILNIFMIHEFSFIGAAITNILTEILVTGLCYLYAKRVLDFTLNLSVFGSTLIISAFFFPIAYGIRVLHLSFVLQESLIIITCGIFYVLTSLLISKDETILEIKNRIFKAK